MEAQMRRRTVPIVVSIVVLIAAALLFAGWTARDRAARNRFAAQLVHGNPALGPDKIRKYGCYSCHTIAGVAGANGLVGPPLSGMRDRVFIAGEVPNTPENITSWIQHPRKVEPNTAMPEMGVTDQDSRDIAAYLYTLQ
jgi:cytochrome c